MSITKVPTLAHGIEQALKQLGPFTAWLHRTDGSVIYDVVEGLEGNCVVLKGQEPVDLDEIASIMTTYEEPL